MVVIKSKNKRVLIISSLFPPTHDIAAVRIGKFAKHLPEFGWEPIVLTTDIDKRKPQTLLLEVSEKNIIRVPYLNFIPTLYRRLGGEGNPPPSSPSRHVSPKRVLLVLIRMMRPLYNLPIVDRLVFAPRNWSHPGVIRGLEIIHSHDIDLVFSTFPPSTNPIIASHLHRKTLIPWVAEFRDLWLDPRYEKGRLYQFFDRKLERRIHRGASILVGVSEPMCELLESTHQKKSIAITNGFDETDYQGDVPLLDKFTLTYAGNVGPKQYPVSLFKALKELLDEGKISPDNLEVRFFGGRSLNSLFPLINSYCLDDIVKIHELVPFQESIVKQRESSALLLLWWASPLGRHVYTAKIFEYLGAGRPVLGIALKGGIIDELLTKSGCGKVATEVSEIKTLLTKWLEEFREHGEIKSYFNPNMEIIKSYTRREQTRKLARVFDEVTEGKY